jgi:hypothetical protein
LELFQSHVILVKRKALEYARNLIDFAGRARISFTRKKIATERDRTADLLITNQLLYHLSYGGLGFVSADGIKQNTTKLAM